MAPKFYKPDPSKDAWYRNAYPANDNIEVEYELQFGKDLIVPGTPLKIKNKRGVFKFRCVAYHKELESRWFDCIDDVTKEWRSFRIDQIRNVVKPKKFRAKRKKK